MTLNDLERRENYNAPCSAVSLR